MFSVKCALARKIFDMWGIQPFIAEIIVLFYFSRVVRFKAQECWHGNFYEQ